MYKYLPHKQNFQCDRHEEPRPNSQRCSRSPEACNSPRNSSHMEAEFLLKKAYLLSLEDHHPTRGKNNIKDNE